MGEVSLTVVGKAERKKKNYQIFLEF